MCVWGVECRGDGEGTSDPLDIFLFSLFRWCFDLDVNFAGGGWSEGLKRGVIVKGVCVRCGRPFRYVHKAV